LLAQTLPDLAQGRTSNRCGAADSFFGRSQ
jgi:hypothetical protein